MDLLKQHRSLGRQQKRGERESSGKSNHGRLNNPESDEDEERQNVEQGERVLYADDDSPCYEPEEYWAFQKEILSK